MALVPAACLAHAPVAQEPRVQRSCTHGNLSEVQRMCPACYIYIHNWSQGCSAAALTATLRRSNKKYMSNVYIVIIPFPKLLCSRSRHGALVGAKGVALCFVLSREHQVWYILRVCMRVCMNALCTHRDESWCRDDLGVKIYVYIYIHAYKHIYICTHIYIHIHLDIYFLYYILHIRSHLGSSTSNTIHPI